MTAAYIINRLPSRVIEFKTPYEVLYGHKPDYEAMRVFGCLVYSRNTETKGDKFEVRGRPGVFIGYPQGQKGYKIYDLDSNKVIISRDVRFVEQSFPLAESVQQEQEGEDTILQDLHYPHDEDPVDIKNQDTEGESNGHHETTNDQEDSEATPEPQQEQEEINDDDELREQEENQPNQREKRARVQPKRLEDFIVKLPPR